MNQTSPSPDSSGNESAIQSWLHWKLSRARTVDAAGGGEEERRGHRLFRQALRFDAFLNDRLSQLYKKTPRPPLQAILHLAGAEMMLSDEGDRPVIVHYWVNRARKLSKGEGSFANAVLRRLDVSRPASPPTDPMAWGRYFSHSDFLVHRWLSQWGGEQTQQLLQWNQENPPIFVRWRSSSEPDPELPLTTTNFPGFWRWTGENWSLLLAALRKGDCYVQDPATRLAPGMLAARAGETVLDLCAAPGGKALQILDGAGGEIDLTLVDLPGPRMIPLEQNLERIASACPPSLVKLDLLGEDLRLLRDRRPEGWARVLLDAPCSNSAVIARRPEVKSRLSEEDFKVLPERQLKLLEVAASLVAPGGSLVYSTCSMDPEENRGVVDTFLSRSAGSDFSLEQEQQIFPGEEGTDGAYAARLLRRL